MHDDAYIGGRSENNINALCMTISGGRIKQLDIFCRVTGFTSDLLSFIAVELIRFFHGAIHSSTPTTYYLLLVYMFMKRQQGEVSEITHTVSRPIVRRTAVRVAEGPR